MNQKRNLGMLMALAALLTSLIAAFSGDQAASQEATRSVTRPNVHVSNAITYQGYLEDGGQPVDGNFAMGDDHHVFLPVLVTRRLNPLLFVASENGGDIYRINADGTGLVNLTNLPKYYRQLAWSSNGSLIAFVDSDGLHIMQADGSGLTDLASNGVQPAWSPDNSMIVFTSGIGPYHEISIIHADGTGLRLLVDTGNRQEFLSSPDWSPNGDKIAYTYTYGPYLVSTIYTVSPDGSGISGLAGGFGPHWSPDGSLIAFTKEEADGLHINVIQADGSGLTDLALGSAPSWSPDGSKIAYQCENGQICVMNADGSSQTNVSGEIGACSWPSWAADGSRIAFIESGSTSNGRLLTVNPDGTRKLLVSEQPLETSKTELAWQP